MSAFLEGVVTGIATSAIVAAIVYWLQKRDSDRSAILLGAQLESSTQVTREALRTTIEVRDVANELHQAVLAGQIKAASDADRETLRPEHIAKAETYLELLNTSASLDIKALHTSLIGEEVVYAGVLRDANVSVSGGVDIGSPLVPLQAEVVPQRLQEWLTSLSSLLSARPSLNVQDTIKRIAELHVDLMRIHPFFDGNGLVGRALLAAVGKKLVGRVLLVPRADPRYFIALRTALAGDVNALIAYLELNSDAGPPKA